MKYRYLIERSPLSEALLGEWIVSQITAEDESGFTVERGSTVEVACELAEALEPDESLRWRPAPGAWQPDAVLVSSWLDDGVEENRDS